MLGWRTSITALVAGLGVAAANSAPFQAETGVFTVTQAGNQVMTERFTRTATTLESDLRIAGGLRVTFSARLNNGVVTDITLRAFAPTDTVSPAQTASFRFTADSMELETTREGSPVREKLAAPSGSVPFVNPSVVWMEEVVQAARRAGGNNVTVPVAILSAPQQVIRATVTFASPTQATLRLAEAEMMLTLDARGRILRGESAGQDVVITRS